MDKRRQKSKQTIKDKSKDWIFDTAAKPRKKNSYSLMQMQSDLKDIFIPLLKEYYNKTVRGFRRVFVNLNARHPLFRKTTPF